MTRMTGVIYRYDVRVPHAMSCECGHHQVVMEQDHHTALNAFLELGWKQIKGSMYFRCPWCWEKLEDNRND